MNRRTSGAKLQGTRESVRRRCGPFVVEALR